jgi:PAS domain S-box-containing protein
MQNKTNFENLIEPKVLQQIQESLASKNGLGIVIVNEQGESLTEISNHLVIRSKSEVHSLQLLKVLLQVPSEIKQPGLTDNKPIFASYMDGLVTRAICPILFQNRLAFIVLFARMEEKNNYSQFDHWAQALKENPISEKTCLALLDSQPQAPSSEVSEIIEELTTTFEILFEAGLDRENTLGTTTSQEQEIYFLQSLEEMQDGTLYATNTGDILDADRSALNMLGYENINEMDGLNFFNHFVMKDQDRLSIGAALTQIGKLERYHLDIERKDGEMRPIHLTILPYKDEKKGVLGYKFNLSAKPVAAKVALEREENAYAGTNGDSETPGDKIAWTPDLDELLTVFDEGGTANANDRNLMVDPDLLDELIIEEPDSIVASSPVTDYASIIEDDEPEKSDTSFLELRREIPSDLLKIEPDIIESISEPIPGATMLSDLGGEISEANEAALAMFNLQPEKAAGRNLFDLFSEKEQLILRGCVKEAAYGRNSRSEAILPATSEGRPRLWIKVRRLAAHDTEGARLLWLFQAQEKPRTLLQARRKTEVPVADVLPLFFDCHWAIYIDDIANFLQGNIENRPESVPFNSIKPAPLLESLFNRWISHTEESWERFANECMIVMETGEVAANIITSHRNESGPGLRHFRHVVYPLFSSSQIVGVQGLCIEITSSEGNTLAQGMKTDANLDQADLQRTQWTGEEVGRLLDNSGQALVTIERDGNLTVHNPILFSLLGYNEKEMESIPFTRLVSLEDRERIWNATQQILNSQEDRCQVEFNAIRCDKTFVALQGTFWPRTNNSQVTGIRAVLSEATPVKGKTEATSCLQKLDGLGLVTGGMAHDFGNLLTEIFGYTSLLLMEEDLADKYRETVVHIQKVTQWATQLTRQLLYFSRFEKPHLMPVQFNRVIKQSIDLMRHLFPNNIEIKQELDGQLGLMMGDSLQLQQVVNNLCMNARDAMSNGGSLTLVTKNIIADSKTYPEVGLSNKRNYILLQVIDQGSGISSEIKDHIFEPFFSTKVPGKGIGLGLASAYGIVKNHDGFIHADTKAKFGTTFSLFFPAVNRPRQSEKRLSIDAKGGNEAILIIDDELDIIEVNSIMLEKSGYTVYKASSARVGLEILKNNLEKISLVIIDVILPDLRGPVCAEKVHEIRPDLPIVLSSGYQKNADYAKVINQSGGTWLQKPYDSAILLQTVRKVLDKSKAAKGLN